MAVPDNPVAIRCSGSTFEATNRSAALSNVTFVDEAPAVRWSATSPPHDVAAARGMPTSIWRPRPTRPSTAAAASTACVGCGSPCGRAWAHVGDVDGGYCQRWAYDRDSY